MSKSDFPVLLHLLTLVITSYLSAEQREFIWLDAGYYTDHPSTELNYLVKIDNEGKLRWAKNSEVVDTGAGRWKDAGGGQGIVPQAAGDEDAPPPRSSFDSIPVIASPTVTNEEKDAAMHYAGQAKGKSKLMKIMKRHFTLNGMMDRLLRMTVKKNTWIYISDKKGLLLSSMCVCMSAKLNWLFSIRKYIYWYQRWPPPLLLSDIKLNMAQ